MKLGNSGGNNTGKTYLKRDSLDYNKLTGEDYARLDDFNTWYTDNIDQLEYELKEKNSFDEDIANDTYTSICESILFAKLEIEDYKSYFSRAYFTNCIQTKIKERRYILPEDQALTVQIHKSHNDWSNDDDKKELIDEILAFVKDQHKESDYQIFYQYMMMENRNYKNLSAITGVKYHIIQRTIRNIKINIQSNIDLISKRKQIQ